MRDINAIADDLNSLAAGDFDWNRPGAPGWERLQGLCDEMLERNEPAVCAPLMFAVMERLDKSDLGSPGPLVHTMEKWQGHYEDFLAESLFRKPSPLGVWMANRMLNTYPANADRWLALLRGVAVHPKASFEAKRLAADFLHYQAGRDV
jgi:hypothetical protein